jgi:hypothetical protein
MSVNALFMRLGLLNVKEDACRQATRTTSGAAEDVAIVGQVVYLPMLMHQMSCDTVPGHNYRDYR